MYSFQAFHILFLIFLLSFNLVKWCILVVTVLWVALRICLTVDARCLHLLHLLMDPPEMYSLQALHILFLIFLLSYNLVNSESSYFQTQGIEQPPPGTKGGRPYIKEF